MTTAQKIKVALIDLGLNLAVIIILVVLIRSFVIAPFQVSGPSMCDTLNMINGECVENGTTVGEFMIINKISYIFSDPTRGDIVIFKPKDGEHYYIKRIVGIPGDKVEIKKDKFVYVTPLGGEEVKIDETYLNADNFGHTYPAHENKRIFNVPTDRYFVMGDNRSHSSDSRHCFQFSPTGCIYDKDRAFITKSDISGKALLTLWPFQNIKLIKNF
ncbi:signal peptidase I, partial [Candidatus Peregrinibacteria bacterium]|nr:signal peptidase I [Candidatus Peregrinibacteria bacterium]